MTTFNTGRLAEKAAAEYLKGLGFKIVQQNWRTRFCEIDIVAQKDKTTYFVEAKYRHSLAQGSGLDYITSKKLKQMEFAARMWVSDHRWPNDYNLSAIEVTGPHFEVTNFIDII